MLKKLIKPLTILAFTGTLIACIGGEEPGSISSLDPDNNSSNQESSDQSSSITTTDESNPSTSSSSTPSSATSSSQETTSTDDTPSSESTENESSEAASSPATDESSDATEPSSADTDPISVDSDSYGHCEEEGNEITKILCTEYYWSGDYLEVNTVDAAQSGEVTFTKYPQNFNYLANECKVCKENDTLMITDGEITFLKGNKYYNPDYVKAPLKDVIAGADAALKLFFKKFTFDISGKTITSEHMPILLELWNEDKTYILQYIPDNLEDNGGIPTNTKNVNWEESGEGSCSHPACKS